MIQRRDPIHITLLTVTLTGLGKHTSSNLFWLYNVIIYVYVLFTKILIDSSIVPIITIHLQNLGLKAKSKLSQVQTSSLHVPNLIQMIK